MKATYKKIVNSGLYGLAVTTLLDQSKQRIVSTGSVWDSWLFFIILACKVGS